MIPHRIRPYFQIKHQNQDDDGSLIEGKLTCCNAQDFEILTAGKIKRSAFSKEHLLPMDDVLALNACCRRCEKRILLFDSRCDGYDQIGHEHPEPLKARKVACSKCGGNAFSVTIKYEFPSIHDLETLGIAEMDNAFTWIWVTLECNLCGKRYVNFLDYEAG